MCRIGAEGECSTGETEDLDIEVDVVETSEPEDLATASNRYHQNHHHHHRSLGAGKQNGAAAAAGGSKKKRCRETVSASSEDGDDRTPPPHDTAQASPAKNLSSMLAKCNSPDMAATECYLESVSKELWSKFHELGTEMIITKTGRYVPAIRTCYLPLDFILHFCINILNMFTFMSERLRFLTNTIYRIWNILHY